jgi:predicted nucleotidyltransferase component of viral defense system
MKKLLIVFLLGITLHSYSQSVFGYWYGYANVKTNSSANNYLVELILQPEKGYVKGILNYYFKNSFRSLTVKGNYNNATRQLSLYNIPVIYNGSVSSFEVDCIMNMQGTLRVAKAGSNLVGSFIGLPQYKNTCADINFNLSLNADISKKDSVLTALREYKETYQLWKPTEADTLVAANIIQRKVINYVIEDQYKERENVLNDEIEVASDTLKVDFYDNGEIDGDSISVFFNNKLLAFHQRLSARSIHFDLVLDSLQKINELTMFADNLGSIPPNTALMQINDGKKRYDVRMTSNLTQNATIKIKRKRDGIKAPK